MKYEKRIHLEIKVKNIQMHLNTSCFHDSLVIRIEYKKKFIFIVFFWILLHVSCLSKTLTRLTSTLVVARL